MDHKIIKAQACQNTFLLVDCLDQTTLKEQSVQTIHKQLLLSKRDDAMILLHGKKTRQSLSFQMIVLGVDQKFGDFCGNGSRATAAYLFKKYPNYQRFFLQLGQVLHELIKLENDIYTTELPKVNFIPKKRFIPNVTLFKNTYAYYTFQSYQLIYADMVEPHLVLNAKMSEDDVFQLGRAINQQPLDFPQGINVTVYYQITEGSICAITYERGVQRLTQSCGSGACCAAIIYLNDKPGKVFVKNPGGSLKVTNLPQKVLLTGSAFIDSVE